MYCIPRQKLSLTFTDIFTLLFRSFWRGATHTTDEHQFIRALSRYLGSDHIGLVPSASWAFYHVLAFYGVDGRTIYLPAHVYPMFPEVAEALGGRVAYLPMRDDTLSIDPVETLDMVSEGDIVLFPYYYGNIPAGAHTLLSSLKTKGCLVICDSVQYFYPDKKTCSLADVILYSFSRAKDLDLMGGAAVIGNSPGVLSFLKERYLSEPLPSRRKLLFLWVKYLYMKFFTSFPFFHFITFPLLLVSAYTKRKGIAGSPHVLFGDQKVESIIRWSFRMVNIQFWMGERKLRNLKSVIDERIHYGSRLYRVIEECGTVGLPRSQHSIYYLFPLVGVDADLRVPFLVKGIDTKEFFLRDCGTMPTSKRLIFLPVSALRKGTYHSFERTLLDAFSTFVEDIEYHSGTS